MKLDDILEEYTWLIRYLVRKKVNAADSDDVIQNILLIVCRGYDTIRDPSGTGAWIRTVVQNHIANYYRNKSREIPVCEIPETYVPDAAFGHDSVECVYEDISTTEILTKLPLKYREVMVLRYLEEMSVSEIAQHKGIKPGDVSNLLSYGKRLLIKRYAGRKVSIK